MWLWPPLMQRELDNFCYQANNCRVRKQKDKILPSGVSPDYAYDFPECFGGTDCLEPVDVGIVQEMLDSMQKEKDSMSDWGVPEEFADRAQQVYDTLGISEVTMSNVWLVFSTMINFL